MTNPRIQTQVFKAKLDLGSMSVQEFTNAICDSIMEKLYSNARWLWVEQLYGDRIIVYVEAEDFPGKYYEHSFDHKDDGSFEFGPAVEVLRVSQFVRV